MEDPGKESDNTANREKNLSLAGVGSGVARTLVRTEG